MKKNTPGLLTLAGQEVTFRNLAICAVVLMLACYFTAQFIAAVLLPNHLNTVHTLLETTGIFIALFTFILMWNQPEESWVVSQTVGYGFLVISIFLIFHAFFYQGLGTGQGVNSGLTFKYSTLARLGEAVVFLLGSLGVSWRNRTSWLQLFLIILLSLTLAVFIYAFPQIAPKLSLTSDYITARTTSRVVEQLVIVAILLVAVFPLSKKIKQKERISYYYLFIGLLLAIAAGICFAAYPNVYSVWYLCGHLLKITFYFLIYRGIVVTALKYPYESKYRALRYMESILDALPMGIMIFNRDRKLTYTNGRVEKFFHSHKGKLIGMDDAAFSRTHLGDTPLISQVMDGSLQPEIITLVHPEGGVFKLVVEGEKLSTGDYVLAFVRARDEQDLGKIKIQTRTILDTITNPVFIIDKQKVVVACNRAVQSLPGIDIEDIEGKKLSEIKNRIKIREYFKFNSDPDKMEKWQLVIEDQSGEGREILIHQSVVENADGETIGSIIVATDLTGLQEHQHQMQQQEKLAALGQMAAGIVHEIKNPLTAIKGFSQILTSSNLSREETREYAGIIEEATNQMNKVVSDFLMFARPGNPCLQPVTLNSLVRSLHFMLEGHIFMRNIRVGYNLCAEEEEYYVTIDPDQVKQVMLNLVKNALEAAEMSPQPLVIVSTRSDPRQGVMIMEVMDNGPGISVEQMERLGDPFYTTKDSGTGLGLSICYQLVQNNRGKIAVESQPGKGTTFRLAFPYG